MENQSNSLWHQNASVGTIKGILLVQSATAFQAIFKYIDNRTIGTLSALKYLIPSIFKKQYSMENQSNLLWYQNASFGTKMNAVGSECNCLSSNIQIKIIQTEQVVETNDSRSTSCSHSFMKSFNS